MDDTRRPEDTGIDAYRRYRAGEGSALEELIGIYREGLTLFLYGIVHDPLDAEALMMDTFARFIVKGKQFEGHASLKTYLYAIGRNLALRHLKKHRHERHLPLDDDYAAPDSPETEYLRGEDQQRLYAALRQIRADYRETLHLLYFEGMSYAEAGKVLHKTDKQISDLAYRGKMVLKVKMESEAVGYEG